MRSHPRITLLNNVHSLQNFQIRVTANPLPRTTPTPQPAKEKDKNEKREREYKMIKRKRCKDKTSKQDKYSASMPEVPHIGESKCNSILVTTFNCISIPDASPRLSNNTDSTFTCFFNSIIPCCYTQKLKFRLTSFKNTFFTLVA